MDSLHQQNQLWRPVWQPRRHELALELGYDAGFGPGTLAPDVAGFVAQQVVSRGLATRGQLRGGGSV